MTGVTTIAELRARYREEALEQRINPRDVDLLLADELGKPVTFLLSHGEDSIDAEAVERFTVRLTRRYEGEPLQYIRGRCEFYGREFLVDHRAFIPRPETEFVVEAALDRLPRKARVVDVGTGSGCIAVTLSLERRDLRVLGVDLSLDALSVARHNARRLGSPARFAGSDLLGAIRGKLDAVVSNPPYVPVDEVPQLQREVQFHEPRLALTAGGNGLDVIERLLRQVDAPLMILEIGFRQIEAIPRLAEGLGWELIETRDDLAAIPRVVVLSKSV